MSAAAAVVTHPRRIPADPSSRCAEPLRATYTEDDDGIHLFCDVCLFDHPVGFSPTVPDLAAAIRRIDGGVT